MAGTSIGFLVIIAGLLFWIWFLRTSRKKAIQRVAEEHKMVRLLVLYLMREHETLLKTKPGSAVLQIMRLKGRIAQMLTSVGSEKYVAEARLYFENLRKEAANGVRPGETARPKGKRRSSK
jgi:hypothetical protein